MQSEMNVTPFLDILLVLLILFMFLCLNQQKLLTAHLPDPSARATEPHRRSCSRYTGTTPTRSTRRGARARIWRSEFAASTTGDRPGPSSFAAPGVRYQDVVTAVDIARGAGVIAVGLASRPK